MNFFNNLSIKNKLVTIIFTTTLVIIITGFSFVIYTNVESFKNNMIRESDLIASVTADYCQPYLQFKYVNDAEESLENLSTVSTVVYAAIFDENEILFASYDKDSIGFVPPKLQPESIFFEEGYLHVFKEVIYEDEKYGTLYLKSSTEELNAKINQFLLIIFFLTLVLSGVSFFAALKLQAIISAPILKLADTAQHISQKADYSVRVKKEGNDELGLLFEGFNNMLFQIENQSTERDRVERALRDSEHRLQTITAISPVGIFRSNVDGELIWGNQKSLELRDLSLVEAAGRGWEKTIHPEDKERVELEWYNAVNAHRPYISEYRFLHRDESVIWVLAQSVAEYDSEGNVQGFVGTITDITERKIVEKALLESEQYNRMLFDLSPIGFALLKSDGSFVDVNLAFTNLIGKPYEDILKLDIHSISNGKFMTSEFSELQNLSEDKKYGPSKTELIHGSGHSVPVLVNGKIIIRKDQKIIWLSIEDLTEQIKLEKDKENLEIQLRQQQKLESIGTLASGVAHEINNPLMGIINYATLVNRRIKDETIKEYSSGIIFEGERVAKIVKNLLSFARQEKESHHFEDISTMIENALSLIRASLRKDKIELIVNVEEKLQKVKCNNTQIEQVIINLLTNARDALNNKYTDFDENKIIILKAYSFLKGENKFIRILVEDYGDGIDDETLLRIFDPFFTTKPRDKGTGLGLSISYGIIKDHKTELKVETKKGEFTRFFFDLIVNNI